MLHVTNGDVVAELLGRTGLRGEILPWDDVLHEGPVPLGGDDERLDRIRAEFLESAGWAAYEDALERFRHRRERLAEERSEVVLWFEHDLFDQLQLIQLLDLLGRADAPPRTIGLVSPGGYLSSLSPAQLAALLPTRERVGRPALELARTAWDAFRAPDPRRLDELAASPTPPLDDLAPALRRHLQEFPSVDGGLGRTERQILELVSSGVDDRHELFRENGTYEEAVYLGDGAFFLQLRRLDRAGALLDRGTIGLTELGRAVVTGEADLVRTAGVHRWLGGVELEGHEVRWRWDEAARRLVELGGAALTC